MREPLRREPSWSGQTVTVMGLGLFGGGLGAAAFALRMGARVTITDQRGPETLGEAVDALLALPGAERVRLVLGEHRQEDFTDADIVIVNPAVPPTAPFLRVARESGARVTSAIELLLGGLRCRVVAVTGTHGKSSTVHFTAELLRAGLGPEVRVALGGNIGGSLLGEMETFGANDVVVLELSSYQLENLSQAFVASAEKTRALDVAAITTLGIDHLARHGTVEAYHAAKWRIADLTGQLGSDPGTIIVPEGERGALPGRPRVVVHGGDSSSAKAMRELRVPGSFQRENVALALAIGAALGADLHRMERAIPGLTGLPHRMERLAEFVELADGRPLAVHDNGVSTTPESTVAALESLGAPAGERIVLVGGQAKRGCDMDALGEAAARLGWSLALFGAAAEEIADVARRAGASLARGQDRDAWPETVEDAVREILRDTDAVARARGGAPNVTPLPALHLLFSPACASFDRYPNFQARAQAFRRALAAGVHRPGETNAAGSDSDTEREQSKD